MKEDKERSYCSATVMAAPEFTVCTRCGGEVELWTDEDETICSVCGQRIFRGETSVH